MQTIFTIYPPTAWIQGWSFSSGPEDSATTLTTGKNTGELVSTADNWTLQLTPESTAPDIRLLSNGLSINARKRPESHHLDVLLIEPNVLRGFTTGLANPRLHAPQEPANEENVTLIENESGTVLLLKNGNHFAFVFGDCEREEAMRKAEAALEKDFEALAYKATAQRELVSHLFGINPRHNPPIALAAEQLRRRLRGETEHIHGLWSCAEGFANETFSINELYPLTKAWALIDPPVARKLVQTALSLQQNNCGFPSWAEAAGPLAAAAPWPLLAQTFEIAWQTNCDPLFLNKNLPTLRKYMQWAIRHFDPQRNRIPTWQNTEELFIDEPFEHGKASPELTVMLLEEIDALCRLCDASDLAESAAASLKEDRANLIYALETVFWNPSEKAFSNIWKDGHILHAPSFGSFIPLMYRNLDSSKRKALLDRFETTQGLPGSNDQENWQEELVSDTKHLTAAHQFLALCALQISDTNRAMLRMFVSRAREGFATWFEHENLKAARQLKIGKTIEHDAFQLSPVISALILITQEEFQIAVGKSSSRFRKLKILSHKLRINKTDLSIIGVSLLAILVVHLIYNLPKIHDADAQLTEAALNYRQGDLQKVFQICTRHPDAPLAQFLTANLLMRSAQPEKAEKLYREALLQEPGSPSALLGLALSLQQTAQFDQAVKRYTDFIEIHGDTYPNAATLANGFRTLAEAEFARPPRWEQLYIQPVMNDLGL